MVQEAHRGLYITFGNLYTLNPKPLETSTHPGLCCVLLALRFLLLGIWATESLRL